MAEKCKDQNGFKSGYQRKPEDVKVEKWSGVYEAAKTVCSSFSSRSSCSEDL